MKGRFHPEKIADPAERLRSLVIDGEIVELSPDLSCPRILSSFKNLLRDADTHMKSSNDEAAFRQYTKFITMLISRFPKHPNFKAMSPALKNDQYRYLKGEAKSRMELAEMLKPKVLAIYEEDAEEARRELEYKKKMRDLSIQEEERKRSLEISKIQSLYDQKILEQTQEQEKLYEKIKPTPSQNTQPSAPPIDQVPSPSAPPSIDRSLKPQHHSVGDKPLVIPKDLSEIFEITVSKNTSANKETCGILAGKNQGTRYAITHCVLPKQSGMPDSCETTDEESLFKVLDSEDLIVLGWIHTHPSQTAFLSSVDLHTHATYQLMLPESVAIVVAPKHKDTRIFKLTQQGMSSISNCRQTGFHPHFPTNGLFYDVGPDEVCMDPSSQPTFIDLR